MEKLNYHAMPDELWKLVEPILAPFMRKKSGGAKALPQRQVLNGILFKLKTGCQWAMIPKCYGSKTTVYEHFRRWSSAGVMEQIFKIIRDKFADEIGFDTEWQAMDGTLIQAPTRSKKNLLRKDWGQIRLIGDEAVVKYIYM